MIWLLGLILGIAYDLPAWYWIIGFFVAAHYDPL
jgi:hypothetical protein